jgi:hypothetical protein
MEGIKQLETEGYQYSDDEKVILVKMFEEYKSNLGKIITKT